MAIVYNWIISSMDEYPSTPDNLTDVVFNIHWRRSASEVVDGKNYYTDTFNMLSVPAPSPEDFTPYSELTFEQVCVWLEAGLDVTEIDAGLEVQLQNLINPPVVSLPLPWIVDPTTTTTTTEAPITTTTTEA